MNDEKAAERAAAERANAIVWELSEREQAMVAGLNDLIVEGGAL